MDLSILGVHSESCMTFLIPGGSSLWFLVVGGFVLLLTLVGGGLSSASSSSADISSKRCSSSRWSGARSLGLSLAGGLGVRVGAGAMGSNCSRMAAVLPWDDPTPLRVFFLTMVGVVSIHLLAAEAYWTGLPFFSFSSSSYAPCLCRCW